MSKQSLKDKTVKGVAWSGLDNVSQYIVTFLVGIVLARLLTPDDYGLIGIIAIFTSISDTIINGGFQNALIRKKSPSEEDYATVFYINIGVSIVLYLLLFLTAPLIAQFFAREELTALIRVASITIVIGGFAIVQRVRLTKRIDFKSQMKVSFIASVTSGVVGIALALAGIGVWALVFQHILSSLLSALFLWFYSKWIPHLMFSKQSFKDLFGYGWKILAGRLLDTLWKDLYQVVVGKFYSPATLGHYTRAKQFAKLFSSNLTTVIQKVTFPVLSEVQNEKDRLISAYRRIIKDTMFISAICMFAVGAVSEPMIYVLIGPKWHIASTFLPFICVSMSLYPLHAINLNMLQVQGRSDIFLILEITKKIIGIAPLCVGIFIGIYWMLIVNIFTGIIYFFLNSWYSGKSIGYSSWQQLRDIMPSYILAIVMAVPVYLLKFLSLSYFLILPIQILVGCSIVFGVSEILRLPEYLELKSIAIGYINKKHNK